MVKGVIEITKEQYDHAMANNGTITRDDEMDVFGVSLLCGYGVYGNSGSKDGDKYVVNFWRGNSCD